MSNIIIFPLEKTKLLKLARYYAKLILNNKVYEANLFALYKIPEQLRAQVGNIAKVLIENEKQRRKE